MTPDDYTQEGLSRRSMVMGGALVAVAAAAYARAPSIVASPLALEELQRLVPGTLGPWRFETSSGLILPPVDPAVDKLYNEVLTRVYTAPSMSPVMLLIAYSHRQDGMLQLHRPEVCYPASGLRIEASQDITLEALPGLNIPARALTATGRGRTEQLVYWTRIGKRYPRSWIDQRVAVAKDNIDGNIPDGALVRISTLDAEWRQADPVLRSFSKALAGALNPRAKDLIFGG